jgi:tetratricopeptide (TPR) repeat protein/predicted Ser/Thr protein kinase
MSVTFADSLQGIGEASSRPARERVTLERGSKLDRYVVLDQLGEGGMGVVYAAYDPELDRKVAVKLLHTDSSRARERLLREAKAVAQLNHPNVVTVHDVGTVGGRVFVAMQLIEGISLRRWLEAEPRTAKEVLRVLRGAGRGLAAAHAVDLVHRDFKPENVLVDRRNHPTVLDFGIARRTETTSATRAHDDEPLEPAPASLGVEDSRPATLTRADALMGTPAYMAPEQHLREPVEPRSDQFGFCVVAWEALFGQRPFAGDTAEAIAKNVTQGRIREPPRGARGLGRVRRVLTRGLSRKIEGRYPTMNQLLRELLRDPAVGRRRWILAGVAGGGLALYSALQGTTPPPDPCAGGNDRMATAWNDVLRARVKEAFAATSVPYADNAYAAVRGELDTWATDWMHAHRDACEATHLRHEQSHEMLDLRMACLNRRLGEAAALTSVFADADSRGVQNSVAAVKSLGRVEACNDVEALASRVKPPDDPRIRTRVGQLHDELSDAKAKALAGRYDEALRVAQRVAEEAEEIGYLPLQAEVHERLGAIWQGRGEYERSEQALLRAIWAAEESRAEEVAADAWNRLVWVVGVERMQPEQGEVWASFARSALGRLGPDPFREATLTHNLGGLYYRQRDFDRALENYRAALESQMEILGPEDPAVARTLNHLGNVMIEKGELEHAADYCRRALDLRRKILGERHPLVAAALNNLAAIDFRANRPERALESVRQALDLVRGTEGPEELVAWVLWGRIQLGLGNHEESISGFTRAVSIREATLGRDDPGTVGGLRELAIAQQAGGELEDALRTLARAEPMADPYGKAIILLETAEIRARGGDATQARADYDRAIRLLKSNPELNATQIEDLDELRRARVALGLIAEPDSVAG